MLPTVPLDCGLAAVGGTEATFTTGIAFRSDALLAALNFNNGDGSSVISMSYMM